MTRAHQIIRSEHFEINLVLTCLKRLVEAARRGTWAPDVDLFFLILHYIEAFPETIHHPKEEEYLFTAVRGRCPDAGPTIDRLCDEHAEGLDLVTELRASLEAFRRRETARDRFYGAASAFIEAETKHILTEERTILPLSLRVLTAEDWHRIDEAFSQNESPLFGTRRRAEFDKLFGLILRSVPGPVVFNLPAVQAGTGR